MENVNFFKLPTGAQTREQICAKIVLLDAIIDSLYTTALVSVGTGNMSEYEIDTGQTKQRVRYTTTESVVKAIEGYERLRQMLQNKLQPRSFRLMDSKSFRR